MARSSVSSTTTESRSVLRELIVVFAFITATTVAISALSQIPVVGEYQHLIIGMLFVITALRLAQREPGGTQRYGIDMYGVLSPPQDDLPTGIRGTVKDLLSLFRRALPAFLRDTLVASVMGLLIFPLFAIGFYLWHAPPHPFTFQPPSHFLSYIVAQLLLVGLPEEALFRGYFQTRLADLFTRRTQLFGVEFPIVAIAVQALLFAVVHFAADLNPNRLAVFFPALLFGSLRAWRGGIGAAIVFHALCNLVSDNLVRGWL
jgi:membrane protease YdiL (CAAX protease family)